MSIQSIKPYFRARMNALGYTKEHLEAFNTDDIASTLRDRAFHIAIGTIAEVSNNQNHYVSTVDVVVLVFFKGYRSEEDGRLAAMEAWEQIVVECCKAENRVAQASDGIKNVRAQTAQALPVEESQDNLTALEMLFQVDYILDFE